jgi:hypothetical protein
MSRAKRRDNTVLAEVVESPPAKRAREEAGEALDMAAQASTPTASVVTVGPAEAAGGKSGATGHVSKTGELIVQREGGEAVTLRIEGLSARALGHASLLSVNPLPRNRRAPCYRFFREVVEKRSTRVRTVVPHPVTKQPETRDEIVDVPTSFLQCTLCSYRYAFIPNTSRMWEHLSAVHPEAYNEAKGEEARRQAAKLGVAEGARPVTARPVRERPENATDNRRAAAVALFGALEMSRFSACDNRSKPFLLMASTVGRRAWLLSQEAVTKEAIARAGAVSERARQFVEQADAVALVFKLVRAPPSLTAGDRTWMALFAVTLGEDMVCRPVLMALRVLTETPARVESIARTVAEDVREWHLQPAKISAVVSDAVPIVGEAVDRALSSLGLSDVPRLRCFADTLRSVVQDALATPALSRGVERARKVVQRLRASPAARAEFSRLAKGRAVPREDAPPRWRSTVRMLEALLSTRQAAAQALTSIGEGETAAAFDEESARRLESVCEVLHALEVASAVVDAQGWASASMLPVCRFTAREALSSRAQDPEWLRALKQQMLEALEQRCADGPVEARFVRLAQLFDPRFKADSADEGRAARKEAAAEAVRANAAAAAARHAGAVAAAASASAASGPTLPGAGKGDVVESVLSKFRASQPAAAAEEESTEQTELTLFLREPAASAKAAGDALAWWRDRGRFYPRLLALAKRLLVAPLALSEGRAPFRIDAGVFTTRRPRGLRVSALAALRFYAHSADRAVFFPEIEGGDESDGE